MYVFVLLLVAICIVSYVSVVGICLFVSFGGVGIRPRAFLMPLCMYFIAELQPNPLMPILLRVYLFISIRGIFTMGHNRWYLSLLTTIQQYFFSD